MSPIAELMSSQEMLDLPDQDQYERWLIRGELRERPMTLRRPAHARATAAVTGFLHVWLEARPQQRPQLYNGDIFFRIQSDPDTNLGTDVALATAEQAKATGIHDRFIEGPPLLAVEFLSANDTMDDVHEKIHEYLAAGTSLVWLVDPFHSTVTVFQPNEEPVLFNRNQELTSEPTLPGFRVRVDALFQ